MVPSARMLISLLLHASAVIFPVRIGFEYKMEIVMRFVASVRVLGERELLYVLVFVD